MAIRLFDTESEALLFLSSEGFAPVPLADHWYYSRATESVAKVSPQPGFVDVFLWPASAVRGRDFPPLVRALARPTT